MERVSNQLPHGQSLVGWCGRAFANGSRDSFPGSKQHSLREGVSKLTRATLQRLTMLSATFGGGGSTTVWDLWEGEGVSIAAVVQV